MVEIVAYRTITTSIVFMYYTLEIYKGRFQINLNPIPLDEISVVIIMDWLSQFMRSK